MFFLLSKILSFLILPSTWIAILLLLALFLKKEALRKKALIASAVVFFFFSNSFIFNLVMGAWETPATDQRGMPVYKVGVVLGGLSWYDFQLSRIQYVRSADRLFQGIELLQKNKIEKLFISGGSGVVTRPELKEAKFVRDYLLAIGIDSSRIIIESDSRNTRENALRTKEVLDSLGLGGKLLLISSGFHLPRALACYRKAGMQVDPYSTDRYSGEVKFHPEEIFIPHTQTISAWEVLIHEWIGYITYKIAGYC